MIPNNNLSVLPWYDSINDQNARRWWIYGRVYPLFTPAGFIMPFQVMRDKYATPGALIGEESTVAGYLADDGTITTDDVTSMVAEYDLAGNYSEVYFKDIPAPNTHGADPSVMAVAFDEFGGFLEAFTPLTGEYPWSGVWELPAGTWTIRVQYESDDYPGVSGTVHEVDANAPISVFNIYTREGVLVGDYLQDMLDAGLTIKSFMNYEVIVFPGVLPFTGSFDEGQYYAEMGDGVHTWWSEVFTVVGDISPYLKLEWWDSEDFIMDAGTIVYTDPAYKNILYLDADIAKPEYIFEEEGETRDGYFYPFKQISEKRYKFHFLASEYLLDVLRFVRMADFAQVTLGGKTWSLDTFLITPEWEANGDVAGVTAEFDTATVAKKIGVGYVKAQRGDFNDDFNNDFDI